MPPAEPTQQGQRPYRASPELGSSDQITGISQLLGWALMAEQGQTTYGPPSLICLIPLDPTFHEVQDFQDRDGSCRKLWFG